MPGKKKATGSADIEIPDVLRDIVQFNRGDAMAVTAGFVILEANEAYARIYGAASTEELRGFDVSGLLSPASVEAGIERIGRRAAGENLRDFYVYEGKRLDGKELRVEARGVAWPPNPAIALQFLRDVAQRERHLWELEDSEKLYRTMTEALPVGVVFRQVTGELAFANDRATEITGYSRDEIAEGALLAGFDEETRQAVMDAVQKSGRLAYLRIAFTLKNGGTAFMSGACEPLHKPDGTYWGMCYIFQDETERVNAEDALHEAHEDLTRAYEEQRGFLLDVAHEVQTPLEEIAGYYRMLLQRRGGPLSEQQESMVKRSLASAEHMLRIVDNVVSVARLEGGAEAPQPGKCNPRDIVESAISLVLPQAKAKSIEIGAKDACEHLPGIYDEEKLRAILVNLLANAVKFTQQGGIEVSGKCDSQGVEIIVADTGIGIPEDRLATIFDEFQQLDEPHRHKPSGFGIGLAIVAKMVETIGATLTVSSEKGVGTAFTLYAPVLEEDARG